MCDNATEKRFLVTFPHENDTVHPRWTTIEDFASHHWEFVSLCCVLDAFFEGHAVVVFEYMGKARVSFRAWRIEILARDESGIWFGRPTYFALIDRIEAFLDGFFESILRQLLLI